MPDDLRAPLTPAERRKAAEAIIDLRGVETVEGLLRARDELREKWEAESAAHAGALQMAHAYADERDRLREALRECADALEAELDERADRYDLLTDPDGTLREASRRPLRAARAALTEGGNE